MAKPIKYVRTLEMEDPNGLMKELWYDNNCVTVNDFVDWNSLHGEVMTYHINDIGGDDIDE